MKIDLTCTFKRLAPFSAASVGALAFFAGCAGNEARTPTVAEQADFRAAAIKVLEEAAFSDMPTVRIHALEAFGEVAPADGLACLAIPLNVQSLYSGTAFAALLAAGRAAEAGPLPEQLASDIRTRVESPDAHVRLGAIYALHKMNDKSHTSELSDILLRHNDAAVRANAALVLGRLGEPSSIRLLKTALKSEEKTLPKLQILEALTALGDDYAANRLMFEGRSEVAQQCEVALSLLANAGYSSAEELFLYRLQTSPYPEIRLQSARGLARLGSRMGLPLALDMLDFNRPGDSFSDLPPDKCIARIRVLAALVVELVGEPDVVYKLSGMMSDRRQDMDVRIAAARALVRVVDRVRPAALPEEPPAGRVAAAE